jgi:hypothetical protein
MAASLTLVWSGQPGRIRQQLGAHRVGTCLDGAEDGGQGRLHPLRRRGRRGSRLREVHRHRRGLQPGDLRLNSRLTHTLLQHKSARPPAIRPGVLPCPGYGWRVGGEGTASRESAETGGSKEPDRTSSTHMEATAMAHADPTDKPTHADEPLTPSSKSRSWRPCSPPCSAHNFGGCTRSLSAPWSFRATTCSGLAADDSGRGFRLQLPARSGTRGYRQTRLVGACLMPTSGRRASSCD